MRMMGITDKTLGESKVPTDPMAVCLLRPPPLPMCFLWGFSPPHTPAQRFSPSLPVLPSGPLALVPTSAPRTRAWFPLFSLPEKWPWAKTWSGTEMRAGLSPTPLALCCPLLEY